MKKIISAALAAILALSCTSCFGLSKEEKLDKVKEENLDKMKSDANELNKIFEDIYNKIENAEDLDGLGDFAEINGVPFWEDDAEENVDDYAKISDLLTEYKFGSADDFFERQIGDEMYYIIVGNGEVKVVEEDDDENGFLLNGDSSVFLAVEAYRESTFKIEGIVDFDNYNYISTVSAFDVMESECAIVDMLVKAAMNYQEADMTNPMYNGVAANDRNLTVGDVLEDDGMEHGYDFFTREIGEETYKMVIDTSDQVRHFRITVDTEGTAISDSTRICDLLTVQSGGVVDFDDNNYESNVSTLDDMKSDCITVKLLIREALQYQQADIAAYSYNGIAANNKNLTVGDVLEENGMEHGDDFFTRKINGEIYKMVVDTSSGLEVTVDTEGMSINESTKIFDIATAAGLE